MLSMSASAEEEPVEPPECLRIVVQEWVNSGSSHQPGIKWPREPWRAWLNGFDALLTTLPERLDRAAVHRLGHTAHTDPDAALQAFVATMVWGYGNVGYGPWRTSRMLTGCPDAGERLVAVARALRDSKALDGYQLLASKARLTGLGPAFGTKYLYFCSASTGAERALVLDRNVADWLKRNTPLNLNPTWWSHPTYRRYLAHMQSWATTLDVRPEDVEYCIFQSEVDRRGRNQWKAHGRSA
jgi:hypothetical protein